MSEHEAHWYWSTSALFTLALLTPMFLFCLYVWWKLRRVEHVLDYSQNDRELHVGKMYRLRGFPPAFVRVIAFNPMHNPYNYHVQSVTCPNDTWWVDARGKPNNHVARQIRLKGQA